MSTIIIIGSSAAGISAAGKLRDFDPTATIICISKEKTMPYNRCLLADFLSGSRKREQVYTKGEEFFQSKNIDLRLNSEVTALDPTQKTISLKNGQQLRYDTLVITTGRSAFTPPPLNVTLPGVFPFYDLDHVQSALDYIEKVKAHRAIIVGAGITGLECADGLYRQGLKITMIERGKQILGRQIDPEGSKFLQNFLENKGVSFRLSATIASIEQVATPAQPFPILRVTLSTNEVIEVDVILAATGGHQNSEFAQAAGIACDSHGIIVNENQATNLPNIYAAGDVCSIINQASGSRAASTLWPDAVSQGLTAAHSIAGLCRPYEGTFNISSTHVFDTQLVTCGDFTALSEFDSLKKEDPTSYHRFFLQEGVLQGFVMVGNVGNVGQFRKAMLDKVPII